MFSVNAAVSMLNQGFDSGKTVVENATAHAFQLDKNVLKPILIAACVKYNIKFWQINYCLEGNRLSLEKKSHGNIVKIMNVIDMHPKNEIKEIMHLALKSLLRVEEAFKAIEFHAPASKFKGFEFVYCRNNFIRKIAVRTLMTGRKSDDFISLDLSKKEQDISRIINGFRCQYSFQIFNYCFSKYLESMNIKFQLHDSGVLNLCKDGLSVFVFGFINYAHKIEELALKCLIERMCRWSQFNINEICLTLDSEENHQWELYQSQKLIIKDFNQGAITKSYLDDLETKISLRVNHHHRQNEKEEQMERMMNQLKGQGVLMARDTWLIQLLTQCQNKNEGAHFLNGKENLAKLLFEHASFNQSDEYKKKSFKLFLACIQLNFINKKNIQDFDALLDKYDSIELFQECTRSLSEEKKKELKDNIKKRFGYLRKEAMNLCDHWGVLSEDDKTESVSLRQKQSRASQKQGEIADETPLEKKNSKNNGAKEPGPAKDQSAPPLKEICESVLDEIISEAVIKSTMIQSQVNPELAPRESVEELVEIKTMEAVLKSKNKRLEKILINISKSPSLKGSHIKGLLKFETNVMKTIKSENGDKIEFWEYILAELKKREAESCLTLMKIIEAAVASKNTEKLSEQSLLKALRLNQESQRKTELKKRLLEEATKRLHVKSAEVIKTMNVDLEALLSKVYEVMLDKQNSLQCKKNEEKIWEYTLKKSQERDAQLVIMFEEIGMVCLPFSSLEGALA